MGVEKIKEEERACLQVQIRTKMGKRHNLTRRHVLDNMKGNRL